MPIRITLSHNYNANSRNFLHLFLAFYYTLWCLVSAKKDKKEPSQIVSHIFCTYFYEKKNALDERILTPISLKYLPLYEKMQESYLRILVDIIDA